MSHGSQQLRRFRIARRDGASIEDASEQSGLPLIEARMWAKDDAEFPPPPEAYVLLGHNSGATEKMSEGNIAGEQLRLMVERLERLHEEKKGIADDIKDVMLEAKSQGYDSKIIAWALKERAIKRHVRQERDALRETYGAQLGLFD